MTESTTSSSSSSSSSEPTKFITVFCGSSPGNDPDYIKLAEALGQAMLDRNYGLVYGGGSHGLMGTIAKKVHEGGGKVIGVIPDALKKYERPESAGVDNTKVFGEEIVVKDMHTRKALMSKKSSGFIALPGGYGTMEELLEITTWSQLGIHAKPVVLFNMKGYYQHLINFIEHSAQEGFVAEWCTGIIASGSSAEEVLDKFDTYKAPLPRLGLNWSEADA